MELGKQIKEIRKQEGLTQAQLGEKINMKKEAISRIESGKQNLSLLTLEKIAFALNRKVNENLLIK